MRVRSTGPFPLVGVRGGGRGEGGGRREVETPVEAYAHVDVAKDHAVNAQREMLGELYVCVCMCV